MIKEKHNLCKNQQCDKCPLYVADRKSQSVLYNVCAAGYTENYDMLVDIPDEYLETREDWPVNDAKDALVLIGDLAIDYDNCKTVEGLKELIDEIKGIARAGLSTISQSNEMETE